MASEPTHAQPPPALPDTGAGDGSDFVYHYCALAQGADNTTDYSDGLFSVSTRARPGAWWIQFREYVAAHMHPPRKSHQMAILSVTLIRSPNKSVCGPSPQRAQGTQDSMVGPDFRGQK